LRSGEGLTGKAVMKLVKKPNGYYYAKIMGADGRQKEVSTRSKNKRTAERMVKDSNLEALEQAAQAQVLTADAITRIVAGKKVTLKEALEKWKDRMSMRSRSGKTIYNSYISIARWLSEMKLTNRPPAFVDLSHVSRYVNGTKPGIRNGIRDGIKASSRRTTLSCIKTFIEFCADEGWRVGNPAKGVDISMEELSHAQKEKREVKLFSEADVLRIAAATDSPFWRFATSVSFATGLRLGDICCLEWECFDGPVMTVWTDKRDKRVGPFTLEGEALRHLKSIPVTDPKFLFPLQRDIYKSATRRALLSVQFKKLCTAVELEGHSFHGLRHTYASLTYRSEKENLIKRLQRELAEIKVSEDLGHSNTDTTKGYIHKT
jgi:integrase